MNKELSLPMYDVHRPDTQALWSALKPLIAAQGLATECLDIVWPEGDLLAYWRSDKMLLSQTCGYPFVTQLAEAKLVGCFHYNATGCDTYRYRSFLVSRVADKRKTLEAFRGRRAVCNSSDSQSGYNTLRKMIAPFALQGRFFAETTFSGSHRQSLVEIKKGTADIAAIDCITWGLLQRHTPEILRDLTIVGQSPRVPGLPLITAQQTSPDTLSSLQKAVIRLVNDPVYREICAALFISGFSTISRKEYDVILEWEREAAENGVFSL